MNVLRNLMVAVMCGLLGGSVLLLGCHPPAASSISPTAVAKPSVAQPSSLLQVDLRDPARPVASDHPITLNAARNEWTQFAIRIPSATLDGYQLRIGLPKLSGGEVTLPAAAVSAFEVLPVPVDMNRAAYVRHTGETTTTRNLPRALLPRKFVGETTLSLTGLHQPQGSSSTASPATLWIDLKVPSAMPAGEYVASVDLLKENESQPRASLPLRLTVYDFNLPNERHLQMVGRLEWDRLEKLFPDRFETFTASWLNRREARYAQTIKTLDELVALAQANRAALVIPSLRPVTKWPANAPPEIDWRDFDSVVAPWFSGEAFGDRVGLRYWPVPAAEMLDRYDRKSQLEYWSLAAAHFDQNRWLQISAVVLEKLLPGHSGPAERVELSTQAAEILSANPRVRVLLPLEDDQLQLATRDNPTLIDPASTSRLLTPSPTLVSAPPLRPWPQGVERPEHWLRTDLPGLVPYIGAGGGEQDVRVWAWLAFLRHVTTYGASAAHDDHFVLWDNILPTASSTLQAADPNEVTWFYPGAWFGVDQPVASIQLKWLRRAEQDYEYLRLARERGEVINALQMARLITKLVELQPGQAPDPVYSLMCGTSDSRVWDDARGLLAETILLRSPGETPDAPRQQELYLHTMQWAAPQERPLLMGRTADWSWSASAPDPRRGGRWVDLKLGLDIYNASETTPDQNRLHWSQVPSGWEIHPQELEVPRLRTYHVLRATLEQKFNLDHLSSAARQPMELQFVDGFRKVASPLKLVLPVAASDRREGRLSIDGMMDDWSGDDAIQAGPMVRMFNRPALQRQEVQAASTPSHLYTSWARENFYVAFALEGLAASSEGRIGRNFVDYQQRRAWGEDLCELLIQPVYASNTLGPLLHIVCKPNGAATVERKPDPRSGAAPMWQAIEGTTVRYASILPQGNTWHGEIALPWALILGPNGDVPTLLRFNFSQHRAATGESASWAGPVDFGRDEAFMGLIYLRSPDQNGTNNIVKTER